MSNNKPNILWITTDSQRFDTINALGNKHINTPNLDFLVKKGVSFVNTYAQNPICQPSRASFLTGRYPRTTLIRQNGQECIPDNEVLISRVLADHGYNCGLVGKLHISSAKKRIEKRINDGYSVFRWNHTPTQNPDEIDGGKGDAYQQWLKKKGVSWKEVYNSPDKQELAGPGIAEDYHRATWCAEDAIDFINNTDNPWFLTLNFFEPHRPFNPPAEFFNNYNPDKLPDPHYKPGELDNKPFPQHVDHHGAYGGKRVSFADISPEQRRKITAAYYGMVELIDKKVGEIVNYLEKIGERKNTLIIFTSDHGEMLGDHGLYLKGPYFYDGVVRVPLIMSWPAGFQSDLQSEALVEMVDIVPTLYEILGLTIPERIQGKSLLDLCQGKKNTHRESVYSEFYNSMDVLYNGQKIYATMYRDEAYKIVVYHGIKEGELYNLSEDPHEHNNLWYKETCKREELLKKCFDRSVFTMDPLPTRIASY